MPITSTDLKEYRSTNPDSDGGAISDIEVKDDNLFPDIDAKNAGVAYRKVFRKNTHESLTWKNGRSQIASQPKNAQLLFGLSINHLDSDSGDEGNLNQLDEASVIAIVSDGDDKRKVALIGEDEKGNRQTEVLKLNGNTEVVGTLKFSKLYGAYVYELSQSHGIEIKQGPNGSIRGIILPNTGSSFSWTDGEIKHGDIEPSDSFGLWYRLTWDAGAGSVSGNSVRVKTDGDAD